MGPLQFGNVLPWMLIGQHTSSLLGTGVVLVASPFTI